METRNVIIVDNVEIYIANVVGYYLPFFVRSLHPRVYMSFYTQLFFSRWIMKTILTLLEKHY